MLDGRKVERKSLQPFDFVLVADDYAIAPGVSRGIREALAAGRLSGTGAMTNRPTWPQAARKLVADGLAGHAGLHLNLTCGAPITAPSALAPDGILPTLRPLLAAARRHALPQDETAAEIGAQMDAFADALGRPPAFIDGHQHIQALPQIRDMVFDAIAKRGWENRLWVRDSTDNALSIARRGAELPKAYALKYFGRGFRTALRAAGLRHNEGFSGFSSFAPSGDFAAEFARYLRAPGKRHLIMCHPGHADDDLRAVDPHTASREKELRFLLSPAFLQTLSKACARLTPKPEWPSEHKS